MQDVLIVGAGLSGLTTAYELKKNGIPFQIIECKNNTGGRIHTLNTPGPLEMGATWFGPAHRSLVSLAEELGVTYFEQFTDGNLIYDLQSGQPIQQYAFPENQSPSYRFSNGTSTLIQTLVEAIDSASIRLNTRLTAVTDQGTSLELMTDNGSHSASFTIITIPPRLLINSISFKPPIPESHGQIMNLTQTWMGTSIKFGITYSNPFWRRHGLSGMGFSQTGIIQEVHDHSNEEGNFFALKGFLNPNLKSLHIAEREKLVKNQLIKMFGAEAGNSSSYFDYIWESDPAVSIAGDMTLAPHQNNGHPLLRKTLMNEKLIFSGTETAESYPGYMEGAVVSGKSAAASVIEYVNATV